MQVTVRGVPATCAKKCGNEKDSNKRKTLMFLCGRNGKQNVLPVKRRNQMMPVLPRKKCLKLPKNVQGYA